MGIGLIPHSFEVDLNEDKTIGRCKKCGQIIYLKGYVISDSGCIL